MSSSRQEKIKCPACGHEQPLLIRESIDVMRNPELKEQLLSGVVNRLKCEQCGEEADVLSPLFYHDAENTLAVRLLPGDALPDEADALGDFIDPAMAPAYHFRLVRSMNALKEKVMIAEAGLDDRVVELFKVLMRRGPDSQFQPEDVLLFAGLEQDEAGPVAVFAVLRAEEQLAYSVPFVVLSRFEDEAESHAAALFKSADRWLLVDDRTVAAKIAEEEEE